MEAAPFCRSTFPCLDHLLQGSPTVSGVQHDTKQGRLSQKKTVHKGHEETPKFVLPLTLPAPAHSLTLAPASSPSQPGV